MLPQYTGRYKARPIAWGLSEAPNGNPRFKVQFHLWAFLNGTEWQECDYQITGDFYPLKKDGQINESACRQLEESLGWDRHTSFTGLNYGEWGETDVQVTVETEVYDGKQRMRIGWLNPIDYEGGIKKADPQTVQSLDAKYGALFRATAKQPAAAPAKSNGNGAAASKPAAAPVSPKADAQRAAWQSFTAKWAEWSAEHPEEESLRDAKWKELLKDHFGSTAPKDATAEEWQAFTKVVENDYSPAVGIIPY